MIATTVIRKAILLTVAVGATSGFAQRIRIENVTMSPTGGTLSALDGDVAIIAPAGAVGSSQRIPIGTNPIAPGAPMLLDGSAVTIGRPGAKFDKPIILKLSYAGLTLPTGGQLTNLRICKVWKHRWTIQPGSTLNSAAMTVSLSTTTGGTYALIAQASGPISAEDKVVFRERIYASAPSGAKDGRPWKTTSSQPFSPQFPLEKPMSLLSSDFDCFPESVLANSENGVFYPRFNGIFGDYYAANLDGSGPMRFTDLGFTATTGIDSDATSGVVAFTAKVSGVWGLYKVTPGTPASLITSLSALIPTTQPSMLADGTKVACGFSDGSVRIFALVGGSPTVVAGNIGPLNGLVFNLTGTKLLFGSDSATVRILSLPALTVQDSGVGNFGGYAAWDPTGLNRFIWGGDQYDLRMWPSGDYVTYTEARIRDLIWR